MSYSIGIRSARAAVRVIVLTAACASVAGTACAQVAAPPKVCVASDKWFECAKKVKAAIQATNDAKAALSAANEWADRYDGLYRANAREAWTWDDQKLLEAATEKLYEEALGKFLDPASIALGLALAKYLPRLAAAIEFMGAAPATAFLGLLAPIPIANDFTAAGSDNKMIQKLLLSKLPPVGAGTIQQRYPGLFHKAFLDFQAQKSGKSRP